eukprot:scaffold9872_cov79-Isochrysis_galbana.AAC.4
MRPLPAGAGGAGSCSAGAAAPCCRSSRRGPALSWRGRGGGAEGARAEGCRGTKRRRRPHKACPRRS